MKKLIKLLTALNILNMKINTKYNGKDISITLTKDQLAEIAKQTTNVINAENITYKSALKICQDNDLDPDPQGFYNSRLLELMTIIKALNFLDNNNEEWEADFDDTSVYKYIPYFEKKKSGWVLYHVSDYYDVSGCPAGFYYKVKASAQIIVDRFPDLYNSIIKG